MTYPGFPPPPPRPPSALARRWPGPVGGPRPALVGVLVAAAAVGAVSIPLDRPGLGWLVAAVAAVAALAMATVKAGATTPAARSGATGAPALRGRVGRSAERLTWAAATVALVGVGTVRAAGWLFVFCLLTAGMTGWLAVTDGRTVRGLLLAVLAPPVAVFRAAPWLAKGVRGSGTGPSLGRSVATAAVSIGLLVVFGALFASADVAFANLVDEVLPQLSVGTVVRWAFLFVVLAAGLLGAAFLLAAPPDLTGLGGRTGPRVRRMEWAIPVALLDLLFAAFVLVQVTVLFGDSDHVLRTADLTFAEYARGGFWQLLVVTAGSLLVIAGATRWAPREARPDRRLIRLLLGTLAVLSLVVVASALHRMNIYTTTYGATRLRLLVAACELWLGLIFVLVLVAGVRLRAGWLPRVVLGAAVVALLGLAVANPDRLIADRNIDRYAETGRLDVWYLSSLSADAVPAIDRLTGHRRDCALVAIVAELNAEPDDWRGTNLGRIRARQLLGPDAGRAVWSDCRDVGWPY
jgi:hypothetical protein